MRHHGLPVLVVGGVLEPALEQRVRRAVDGVHLAIRAAAEEPLSRHLRPALAVAVHRVVDRFVVAYVERPPVVRAEEHIVLHGHALPGNGRGGDRDGLERGMPVLGGGPGGEARVAAAEHAYLAVAPGLFADPVDDGGSVGSLVFIGNDCVRALVFAAREGDDTHIPAGREFLGFLSCAFGIHEDGEREQGGQASRCIGPRHDGRERGAVARLDEHVFRGGARQRSECQQERGEIVGLEFHRFFFTGWQTDSTSPYILMRAMSPGWWKATRASPHLSAGSSASRHRPTMPLQGARTQ